MYGTIQSKMYLEYNDIITKERVIREDKVKELEQNKKIDLKTISDARIERIKIINDYIVGYDRSRDVIENLKPSVYIDFIKNKKKVISSLETLKKEIPSKPDMKNVVMELVSEEKRIKKLIEEYYLGKVETVNKEYENKYNEIKKTYAVHDKDKGNNFLIHGHLHHQKNISYEFIKNNIPCALNAGVEINGYKPVAFEDLFTNNSIHYEREVACSK